MKSLHISHHEPPVHCPLDVSIFSPRLFHGETAQGFWTVTYVPPFIRTYDVNQRTFTTMLLKKLLYVYCIFAGHDAHNILAMRTP